MTEGLASVERQINDCVRVFGPNSRAVLLVEFLENLGHSCSPHGGRSLSKLSSVKLGNT